MESLKEKKSLSEDEIQQKIKKIREKTFNSNLRNLVNKITSDKEIKLNEKNETDVPDQKNVLLKKMHNLFYKTINLNDFQYINTNFNPFTLNNKINKEILKKSIKLQLKKLGIDEFAFLIYSKKKKSFVSEISTFYSMNKDNLILSLSENVFNKIFHSKKGILIERSYFCGNLIQQKRTGLKKTKNNNLYCLSQRHFSPLIWKKFVKFTNIINEKIFSPVLIISYDIESQISKDKFFEKFQKKLSLLFYLYFSVHNKFGIENSQISKNPVQHINNYIHLYENDKDIFHITLKNIGVFDNEIFVLMKHIHVKLKTIASSKTSIQYLNRDIMNLFVHTEDLPFIKAYLKELKYLYKNRFEIIDNKR